MYIATRLLFHRQFPISSFVVVSTRKARNPWAVVTRAVQIICGVEIRAAGMLVWSGKVRHTSRIAGFHDAIRFAERERLANYHPAFAVSPATDDDPDDDARARVAAALPAIVELFASTRCAAIAVCWLRSGPRSRTSREHPEP